MSCKQICVNDLTVSVQVDTPTETPDGAGGFTTSWAKKTDIWCKVEEKSGNEKWTHQQLDTVKPSTHFTTHYRADIFTTDRLLLDGIYYNIRRVDDLKREKKFLLIVADGGVVN